MKLTLPYRGVYWPINNVVSSNAFSEKNCTVFFILLNASTKIVTEYCLLVAYKL